MDGHVPTNVDLCREMDELEDEPLATPRTSSDESGSYDNDCEDDSTRSPCAPRDTQRLMAKPSFRVAVPALNLPAANPVNQPLSTAMHTQKAALPKPMLHMQPAILETSRSIKPPALSLPVSATHSPTASPAPLTRRPGTVANPVAKIAVDFVTRICNWNLDARCQLKDAASRILLSKFPELRHDDLIFYDMRKVDINALPDEIQHLGVCVIGSGFSLDDFEKTLSANHQLRMKYKEAQDALVRQGLAMAELDARKQQWSGRQQQMKDELEISRRQLVHLGAQNQDLQRSLADLRSAHDALIKASEQTAKERDSLREDNHVLRSDNRALLAEVPALRQKFSVLQTELHKQSQAQAMALAEAKSWALHNQFVQGCRDPILEEIKSLKELLLRFREVPAQQRRSLNGQSACGFKQSTPLDAHTSPPLEVQDRPTCSLGPASETLLEDALHPSAVENVSGCAAGGKDTIAQLPGGMGKGCDAASTEHVTASPEAHLPLVVDELPLSSKQPATLVSSSSLGSASAYTT